MMLFPLKLKNSLLYKNIKQQFAVMQRKLENVNMKKNVNSPIIFIS